MHAKLGVKLQCGATLHKFYACQALFERVKTSILEKKMLTNVGLSHEKEAGARSCNNPAPASFPQV